MKQQKQDARRWIYYNFPTMKKEKLIESIYIEEYDDRDDNELVVLYSNGEVDSL